MKFRLNQSRSHRIVKKVDDILVAVDELFQKVVAKDLIGEEVPAIFSLTYNVVPLKWPRRGYLVIAFCCYGMDVT